MVQCSKKLRGEEDKKCIEDRCIEDRSGKTNSKNARREVTRRNDLVCSVTALHYDFSMHAGTLVMAHLECCDMSGCIALFKKIDPAVRFIQTVSGNVPDTCYAKLGKEWFSKGPHEDQFMRNN